MIRVMKQLDIGRRNCLISNFKIASNKEIECVFRIRTPNVGMLRHALQISVTQAELSISAQMKATS